MLVRDMYLPPDVVFGVVEVHKHSAPGIRIAEEAQAKLIRNPRIGSWHALSNEEGIVCTTGYPFEVPGSVNPLFVRVAYGNLSLEWVLHDTFSMSQLCWPVPDRCIRLSIDLKLCDDYLRSVAASADDEEALYGEATAPEDEAEHFRAFSA